MHYKADINAPDNDGNTPLHLSTANGHEKVKENVFLFRIEQQIIDLYRHSCDRKTSFSPKARVVQVYGYGSLIFSSLILFKLGVFYHFCLFAAVDAVQFWLLITNISVLSLQCTKALVYFDMQFNVMKINAANEQGDTPLHLASRWGYGKILD